ncbi:RNA-directed DNA polymerase, eukaryota, reverse transcriptase zinc-binding domain protein, partial [Tanacetum coccineum]
MGDRVKLKLTVDMIKIVSDKEIKEALFDIDSSKAALVPKIDTLNKVSDFRPMACCNIIYKCISKILTNRIKEGLSKVVSLNQRAFIPGRHIQDNILITQELLKGYNKKNGTKICAMKIDIQKAYDTISWEFLKEIMLLVRFHETHGSAKGKTRFAWKFVCRPKEQGGLGFKPMHKWNEVLLISQLWKLIDKKESLWVKWASTMKLKGKTYRSVYCEVNSNDCHGWKELMRIKDKIKPYVKFRVGDGKTMSVWHDKWCDQGPLDRCSLGGEGLKKQKTTKGSSSANVTSSSKPTTVQRTKTSSSQPQQQKYDGCSTVQEKYLKKIGRWPFDFYSGMDVVCGCDGGKLRIEFLELIRDGLELTQVEELAKVINPVVLTQSPDSWSWTLNNSGGYTVASSRNMIDSRLLPKEMIMIVVVVTGLRDDNDGGDRSSGGDALVLPTSVSWLGSHPEGVIAAMA